jgi:hypothetical protein
MKNRILQIAMTASIILIVNYQIASAALGVWTQQSSAAYVQGTSRAVGAKKVSKLSSTTWLGEISSSISPSISIPVGWTYWTSRERCNGSIKQQVIHSGRSVTQTSTYDYQYMSTLACGGTRAGQVLGNHEVKGSLLTWYDDWTQSETIP